MLAVTYFRLYGSVGGIVRVFLIRCEKIIANNMAKLVSPPPMFESDYYQWQ